MTHPYTRLFILPAPPDADNDVTEGYELGDVVHVTGGGVYDCRDATEGAAVWEERTGGGHSQSHDHSSAGDGQALAPATTFALTGIIDASLPEEADDWAPTGHATATVIRVAPTDFSNQLFGLAGGFPGRIVILLNVTDMFFVMENEALSSSAANRFALAGQTSIDENQAIALIYDGTSDRWRELSRDRTTAQLQSLITLTANSTYIKGIAIGHNGWIPVSATWTRTGNHTFTVSGDVTATYRKGTKIRCHDSGGGAYKQGVVGSSSHSSGTTTINLFPNTDFTLAAGTLSDTEISYIENPEGFPQWFNYAWAPSNLTGGTQVARWKAVSQGIHLAISAVSPTISGDVIFTLPVASAAPGARPPIGEVAFLDSGVGNYSGMALQVSTTTASVRTGLASGTYVANLAISSTIPFTWGASDELNIKAFYPY